MKKESKKVTQKEVAEHLGISLRATQKHIRNGMPKGSLKNASDWYAMNVNSSSVPLACRKESIEELADWRETEGGSLSLNDQLQTLNEQAAFQKSKMEGMKNDVAGYASWNRIFNETTKQSLAISSKLVEIQKQASEVISLDDIREGLEKCVHEFVTIIENIPERAASSLRGKEKTRVKKDISREIEEAKSKLYDWKPQD